MIRKLAFWLFNKLKKHAKPYDDQLVLALTLQTASLELGKDQYIELAPIKGCCGPFKLSGNGLPTFEYMVFEKKIMEFIKVRVEISKPDRIHYIATIDAKHTMDPKRHGEEVEVTDAYKAPFETLAWHLFNYFPFYMQQHKEALARKQA